MPDADKIGKLSRRWSKIFIEVCEGYFDNSSLANNAMNPLRKDIEDYGNLPIHFLKEASNRLESIRNNPLFLSIHNWSDEDQFIHDLKFIYIQKNRPNQRGINFAMSAYKDLIHKIRNGENIQGDLNEALIRSYIHQIYDGNFTDLASIALENRIDVDRDDVYQRLNEIGIYVDEKIDFLASQITQKGNVKRLRLSSRSTRSKAISIEDDVFSLGNSK